MISLLIVIIGIQLVSGLAGLIMGITAWHRRKRAGRAAIFFCIAAFCVTFYAFAYIGEISTHTLERALTWIKVEYLAIPWITPLWLLFVITITGHEKWLTPGRIALLLVVPFTTLSMSLSNDWHHLFVADATLFDAGSFHTLKLQPGLFYWISQAFDNLCLIVTTGLIIHRVANSLPVFRRQSQILLAGTLIQWGGLIIFLGGLAPYNIDLSSAVLSLSGTVFLFGMFRFRTLDLLPMAREVVFERMSDGIVVLDIHDRIVDFNLAAQKILPELQPTAAGELAVKALATQKALADLIGQTKPDPLEIELNGHHFQIQQTQMTDRRGSPTGKIITLHDITQVRLLLDQLHNLATRDALTGLYNRRYFTELANLEIERMRRQTSMLAVITMDLDHFKRINDTCGHAAGDLVLQAMAGLLKSTIRKIDIPGRVGGEEFWILLPDTALSDALTVAERLRTRIEQTIIPYEANMLTITASFGVATFTPANNQTLSDLMRKADQALYNAKSAGRNCIHVAGPDER